MISQNTIDEINLKASVLEVIGDYVKLKKVGSDYVGLCPFHNEKSASFKVHPIKNIYKCFGCGKSGDSITFLMSYKSKSFLEAISILAEKYNIAFDNEQAAKVYILPPPRLEKMEKSTISYFESIRKISNNTLLRFKVTDSLEWMPKAKSEVLAINFNFYDNEALVNIKFRAKDKDFKLFKDAKLIFYNLDSIKGSKEAIIAEGEIDAMTYHECGLHSVVSVPNGAGTINLEFLDNCFDSFIGIEKIIIATDGDSAGNNLRKELARRLGYERCYKIEYPSEKVVMDLKTNELRPCKDGNEVLIHFGIDWVKGMIENAKLWPIEGILTVEDMQDDILEYWENGFPCGMESGIDGLDKLLKFQEGQFTTVTGMPGSGKSEFIDYILASAALKHGTKSAMVSFENPSSFHATKIMQKVAGKSFAYRRDPSYRMTKEDFGRSLIFTNDHFYFVNIDEVDLSMDGILSKILELVKRKGIKFFVIDPWNYIEHSRSSGMTETEHISLSLTKLKKFCAKTGTHCFLVAHPSKQKKENGKYEVPTLYSISGSAHFYNKTDNGICVHVDGNVVVYVQKVRFDWNGEKGFVEFGFNTMTRQYNLISLNGTPMSATYQNRISPTSWIEPFHEADEQPF